jgi:mannose-6-phosphate isomerase
MIPAKQRTVMPAVDLGGTKIAFAFVDADEPGKSALEYPSTEVVRVKGRTDANRTLRRVAELIRKKTREAEKRGWLVLRTVGMGAPGLYGEDGRVDPRTVPNIPGLAGKKPAKVLEGLLGKGWKVHINNDGVVQAVAAADAFVRSPDYGKKWAKILAGTGGRVIYFGPGTGFGAGKIRVLENKRVEPLPGSQAFFDILIRDEKTAEDLLGGYGIGKAAQDRERKNREQGKAVFSRFTDGSEDSVRAPDRSQQVPLDRISGIVVARAYLSGEKEPKNQAEKILIQVGRDLARLILQLHRGRGSKKLLEWNADDWRSVKGTRVFLVAGLLLKPEGKQVILPAAREALKRSGYGGKIHIVEIDRLPTMKGRERTIGVWGASLLVPREEVLDKKWRHSLVIGNNNIHRYIGQVAKRVFLEESRPVLLAMDGTCGIDWKTGIPRLKGALEKQGIGVSLIDFAGSFKSPGTIERLVLPAMTQEKTFGRIFGGKLEDFLDNDRISDLQERFARYKKQQPRSPRVILCFGSGAACRPLRGLYDILFYRDITREEITRRSSRGLVLPLGARKTQGTGKDQPVYLAGKRFHYVDFPVLDKERKSLLDRIHYYIDDNLTARPKLVSRSVLEEMVSHRAQRPFQLKAFHDAGVWGGQWLKKIRKLPEEMVNCAWAYELMAYHMSVKLPLGDTFLEIPFPVMLDREPDKIMGQRVNRRFNGMWPIRVNYDDCWKGGDMAIQIHPDAAYIRRTFREPLHQDESYYIMAATPGAYVHLGLKEGVDTAEFHELVQRAERDGIPFDHRRFVNVFPARQGDLFLIPAGTIHASGKGCVVLELSSTTDRYTFHFYDYLRPDLNGKLRDIHAKHAFRMLRKYPDRNTPWVKKNLIQKPRCIRRGKDWAEYAIGRLEGLVFEVHRYEFATTVEDDTRGVPHVLSLAEGDAVVIRPLAFPEREFHLPFSETAIVPACTGRYAILNQTNNLSKLLKTIVNPCMYALRPNASKKG